MASTIRTFVVKDQITIREGILRTVKNGLIRRGVTDPNVGFGSDYYILGDAIANELAVVGASCIVAADAQMPDTSQDDDLTRITTVFGLTPQVAAGSVGGIILESTQTTTVPTATELTDELGQRFSVSVGGSYANGDTIPIAAISTGDSTNHDAGDLLQWSSAPPYASDRAAVATGGLVNGADAEDSEVLRGRLYAKLQVPPGSGDWEDVAEKCEASTNSVQKAFVYPAVEGPASCDAAVAAAPTATNKSRVVATPIMSGTVIPFAQGALPRFGLLNVTTVVDTNADVAFGISIPEAKTANPPGPGGGWLNGTTWPAPDGVSTFRHVVTAVTNDSTFTVDAVTTPQANVTRIAWLSPFTWVLHQALVTVVSGTSGAWVVTVDKPFTGIATGCYIWPDCQNASLYVAAALAAFALMGPGEKTTNASALQRGFRHPPPATGWPNSLGPQLLGALTTAQSEVQAAQFFHRTDGTTTVAGSAGHVVPQVPAALADPPLIYVPHHLAFYRIQS